MQSVRHATRWCRQAASHRLLLVDTNWTCPVPCNSTAGTSSTQFFLKKCACLPTNRPRSILACMRKHKRDNNASICVYIYTVRLTAALACASSMRTALRKYFACVPRNQGIAKQWARSRRAATCTHACEVTWDHDPEACRPGNYHACQKMP